MDIVGLLRTILVILGIYYVSKKVRRFMAAKKKSASEKAEYRKPKRKVVYEIKDVEDADFEEIKKDE
jgi:hypothetical protein